MYKIKRKCDVEGEGWDGGCRLIKCTGGIHYVVHCIMLHRCVHAVTMPQESLNMMAYTEKGAEPQMFFFYLLGSTMALPLNSGALKCNLFCFCFSSVFFFLFSREQRGCSNNKAYT